MLFVGTIGSQDFSIPASSNLNYLYPSSSEVIKYQVQWQQALYKKRINELKRSPIGYGKIVLLGNSITEGVEEKIDYFKSDEIINRGISGDFTGGVLARLDEIIYFKPKSVFILIGINDIFDDHPNRVNITSKSVANNIINIANTIKSGSSSTLVYIQTILPVNREKYMKVNDVRLPKYEKPLRIQIKEINYNLMNSKYDYSIIDIYSKFANERGIIKDSYTSDGVHLNDKGYSVWANELNSYFKH